MLLSLLQPRGQNFRFTENVFLRLLGLIYLTAFGSLWPQVVGLIGDQGIVPASQILSAMHADYGWHAYLQAPSLFWLSPTNRMLQAICLLGCVAALLLMLGVATRLAAIAGYLLYLSLVTIGQPFTSFQWDALLLETGFLAIFAGSPWIAIAYRFLLFRLMFESGLVKLTSGDPNWRNGHALRYHFFTQPLPTPLAYYMQQAPDWLLDSLTFTTLFVELVAPFFLFAFPKRIRQIAAALLAAFQLFIALTGNFAFFNLLTMALCLWALDDDCLPTWTKRREQKLASHPKYLRAGVGFVVALSILQIFGLEPSLLESLEIVNPYGLFASMTTSRTELVIEGSDDHIHWRAYSFRYKPGDVARKLPIIAPFQPRLDWQMWFAALGGPSDNYWTKTLVLRLLEGEPRVLGLFESVPFSRPPSVIRIVAYSYTFTDTKERGRTGAVWQRQPLGIWLQPAGPDKIDFR